MGLKVWLGLYRKESAWIQLDALAPGEIRGRLGAQKHLLTPAGFLHTAAIVALANTACRYGCSTRCPTARRDPPAPPAAPAVPDWMVASPFAG
jgi:acyl-coenzyme A thioesterase PaaI-like protein